MSQEIEELRASLKALEVRLRVVEDVQAIHNLKARYGQLADARYQKGRPVEAAELGRLANELGELFSEDAVWDGGKGLGLCRGRDEIVARFREPTLHFSWHYFVKPEIYVEGDHARATWDVLAPCTTRDDVAHWMAGAEDDEYVRVDGCWLHSRMSLRLAFLAPHATGWVRSAGGS